MNTLDILMLSPGEKISKSNLYDLIKYSKQPGSINWIGEDYVIHNTPQQGINWIGSHDNPIAVIIKSYSGKYKEDSSSEHMKYAFKKQGSIVNRTEKANSVIINQKHGKYPLLYFLESGSDFIFLGKFAVAVEYDTYCDLKPYSEDSMNVFSGMMDNGSGISLRVVRHSIRERNLAIIKKVKKNRQWICDICGIDTSKKYGVPCIEAHLIEQESDSYSDASINEQDVILLCPTCHRVVHSIMQSEPADYHDIRYKMISRAIMSD